MLPVMYTKETPGDRKRRNGCHGKDRTLCATPKSYGLGRRRPLRILLGRRVVGVVVRHVGQPNLAAFELDLVMRAACQRVHDVAARMQVLKDRVQVHPRRHLDLRTLPGAPLDDRREASGLLPRLPDESVRADLSIRRR